MKPILVTWSPELKTSETYFGELCYYLSLCLIHFGKQILWNDNHTSNFYAMLMTLMNDGHWSTKCYHFLKIITLYKHFYSGTEWTWPAHQAISPKMVKAKVWVTFYFVKQSKYDIPQCHKNEHTHWRTIISSFHRNLLSNQQFDFHVQSIQYCLTINTSIKNIAISFIIMPISPNWQRIPDFIAGTPL